MLSLTRVLLNAVALLGSLWLAACSDSELLPVTLPIAVTHQDDASTVARPMAEPQVAPPESTASNNAASNNAASKTTAPYTGDLAQLQARGKLRILIPANIGGVFFLPRKGSPVKAQQEAAEAFARLHGMQPELVVVDGFAAMIPALREGRGDVIAANMTVTDKRREQIAFSVPLTTVRQQVIVAAENAEIRKPGDLSGKRVMIPRGSSFWDRLETLRASYPGIELVERPGGFSDEDELDEIVAGRIDASVRDSNVSTMYLAFRDDLKVAFDLPGTDDIAWGVRKESQLLRAALNKFLHLEFASDQGPSLHTDDLAGIKKRRVLRVLMPNNAASYFLYKGELHGFEYDLAKAFADAHRLRLEVIVPESHDQLLQWLAEGRGDIAAGYLEPSEELAAQGFAFSRPYHFAPRHLVVRADDPVRCANRMAGRTVTVRRSSPYWRRLEELQSAGADFVLRAAPEDVETEELIERVARGELEATVADGHLLEIELARGVTVRSAFRLGADRPHAVVVRGGNEALLAALDRFIKKEYRGLVYNILYKKYFTNSHQVRDLAAGRPGASRAQGLSPYDDVTRQYAEQYGFDWRLVTAQMYQESRFDPDAKSFAGALGLLQVMPRTLKFMGFDAIRQPEQGIHAGIKYLDWVRNRFEASLPVSERMWLTLAAYNAGHGHVDDARRLARQQGLDGDRWFGNVEKAMLLLSKKKYASKARHGYVRGIEPVSYVRDIRQRYRAYVELATERMSRAAQDEPDEILLTSRTVSGKAG